MELLVQDQGVEVFEPVVQAMDHAALLAVHVILQVTVGNGQVAGVGHERDRGLEVRGQFDLGRLVADRRQVFEYARLGHLAHEQLRFFHGQDLLLDAAGQALLGVL